MGKSTVSCHRQAIQELIAEIRSTCPRSSQAAFARPASRSVPQLNGSLTLYSLRSLLMRSRIWVGRRSSCSVSLTTHSWSSSGSSLRRRRASRSRRWKLVSVLVETCSQLLIVTNLFVVFGAAATAIDVEAIHDKAKRGEVTQVETAYDNKREGQ